MRPTKTRNRRISPAYTKGRAVGYQEGLEEGKKIGREELKTELKDLLGVVDCEGNHCC